MACGRVVRRFAAGVSAIVLMASCGNGGGDGSSDLLLTVPSRSVAVMQFRHCGDALRFLTDSMSVFRKLDLHRLENARMVLSYDYSARLIPLLAIDVGRASDDTSSVVAGIIGQAEDLGLCCSYTGSALHGRAALLLSPSRASILEAEEHIRAGASIMDARAFPEAVSSWSGEGLVILRGGKAARWLPSSVLSGTVPRRKLVAFLDEIAEWTVFDLPSCEWKDASVRFVTGGKEDYLGTWMPGGQGASSRVREILPEGTSLVLDLPLKSWKEWYSSYRGFLDSRARLARHDSMLASLKGVSGTAPVKWMEQVDPQEIALVRWDSGELLLLRTRRKIREASSGDNPYRGFVPAVFGKAFETADDSCLGRSGCWLAMGSPGDVELFLEGFSSAADLQMPVKDVKFAVWTPEFSLSGAGDGVLFNVY